MDGREEHNLVILVLDVPAANFFGRSTSWNDEFYWDPESEGCCCHGMFSKEER